MLNSMRRCFSFTDQMVSPVLSTRASTFAWAAAISRSTRRCSVTSRKMLRIVTGTPFSNRQFELPEQITTRPSAATNSTSIPETGSPSRTRSKASRTWL